MSKRQSRDEPTLPPRGCDHDAIKLFVGNIPKICTEIMLMPLFESIGKVIEIIIVRDRKSHESKGSGFVWYSTRASALEAIRQLDQKHRLRTIYETSDVEDPGPFMVVREAAIKLAQKKQSKEYLHAHTYGQREEMSRQIILNSLTPQHQTSHEFQDHYSGGASSVRSLQSHSAAVFNSLCSIQEAHTPQDMYHNKQTLDIGLNQQEEASMWAAVGGFLQHQQQQLQSQNPRPGNPRPGTSSGDVGKQDSVPQNLLSDELLLKLHSAQGGASHSGWFESDSFGRRISCDTNDGDLSRQSSLPQNLSSHSDELLFKLFGAHGGASHSGWFESSSSDMSRGNSFETLRLSQLWSNSNTVSDNGSRSLQLPSLSPDSVWTMSRVSSLDRSSNMSSTLSLGMSKQGSMERNSNDRASHAPGSCSWSPSSPLWPHPSHNSANTFQNPIPPPLPDAITLPTPEPLSKIYVQIMKQHSSAVFMSMHNIQNHSGAKLSVQPGSDMNSFVMEISGHEIQVMQATQQLEIVMFNSSCSL